MELSFQISGAIVTGLRYIQVVRRAGINVDKLESMIGSYGPSPEPITKRFVTEEAPSGMIARSGTYSVRSRIVDDDGVTYADFAWQFKLGKVSGVARAKHDRVSGEQLVAKEADGRARSARDCSQDW